MGSKDFKKIGIKTISTKNSIKIFGNPNFKINKKIIIKNFLKDHRVFMTSVVAALSFGGNWQIHDKRAINTSFPDFLKIINQLKNKTYVKKKNILKIAIDLSSGSWCRTLAKAISKHYNLFYLDTGKIYRFIAYLKLSFPKNSIKNF